MEVSQPLDHVTHAVIGGSATIDFGISNSAEFFDILSRTLYTDQIMAVVREVLCNAWDAHIAAGITNKPIQILLDSEHLIVQDFGSGIRREDIGPIYGVYGASTKKLDGAQTGGFGLGCKAPFAYTDHFEVTSSHNGTRTIYNMSKSNAVAKGKPGIIPLASFPTTETGLRVKIPILNKDWARFRELVKRVVSNGEMRAELNKELLPVIAFSEAPHDYLMTTKQVMNPHSAHVNQNRLLLRYGNVIYPIGRTDEILVLYDKVDTLVRRFEHYYLILQAPPDSISVTPSRESLSMQEHTINTLNTLFKNFLAHASKLDDEVFAQGKQRTTDAISKKNYQILFSQGWGFGAVPPDSSKNITTLRDMATYRLTKDYPGTMNLKYRIEDVSFRVTEAVKIKLLEPRLVNTFLEKMPEVIKLPSLYYATDRGDWLHRQVLSKAIMKLRKANLDDSGLFIIDKGQPRVYNSTSILTPWKAVTGRNHLTNFPFLRKVVVVTTAVTDLENRLHSYRRHNLSSPVDGLLCFYARSRKVENIEAIFGVFKKLGYEIIDMTKRHAWEIDDRPEPVPRGKAEPYPGLPALSTIQYKNGNIDNQGYRKEDAIKLPTPELVLLIGARTTNPTALDGFSSLATKALVKLYGNRCGIAKDSTQYKRAMKYGAKDFITTLDAEMPAMLMKSPTVAEYLPFDFIRVRDTIDKYRYDIHALGLIYRDGDLRKEFGLLNNLTEEEEAMINVYNYSTAGFSEDCRKQVKDFFATFPIDPINKQVAKMVSDNDLLSMLDISNIKTGLKTTKRQIYLDVLIKVLKG